MRKKVKILKIEQLTHDVKRFVMERPKNYNFTAGDATYVSIDKFGWRLEERAFTFTGLNGHNYLELIIKRYSDHKGVTEKIHSLKEGDSLIIGKSFSTMRDGKKGVFLAGGAGITPFIAILRQLKKDNKILGNKLFFSNKTTKDIILENELKEIFSENPQDIVFIVSNENTPNYYNGMIDESFLKNKIGDFGQEFYICGPPAMVKQLYKILEKLGANINLINF